VAVPAAPVLVSPLDRATGVALTPTLSWRAVTGATSYQVQVATSATFATTVVDRSGITGTSQGVTGLAGNTTYSWRVRASNAGGAGAWSVVRSFTTVGAAVTRTISGRLTTSSQQFPDNGPYYVLHEVTLVTGQRLELRMQTGVNISFDGVYDIEEEAYLEGNHGGFKARSDTLLIPHDGRYWIVISGDRAGVTGAYTFVATATPGPLDIGPAAKPITIETDRLGEVARRVDDFLLPNFPNPFNAETTIGYEVPEVAKVRVVVYDLGGRQVRVLAEGYQEPGRREVAWDGQDGEGREVASGVYFYRLEIVGRGVVETRQMLLLR
jgi:hypothetical protein